jgi:hypothetical protein
LKLIKCKIKIKNLLRYLSAPEIDDIESDSTDGGSKFKFDLKTKNLKKKLNEEKEDKVENELPIVRRKTRILLESKDVKNYALEFESLYDNYERDVDFIDTLDLGGCDSLNSEKNVNFPNSLNSSLKKKSSLIPYGRKASKPDKEKEDTQTVDTFNLEVDDYFNSKFSQSFKTRKNSILSVLQSNSFKRNLSELENGLNES